MLDNTIYGRARESTRNRNQQYGTQTFTCPSAPSVDMHGNLKKSVNNKGIRRNSQRENTTRGNYEIRSTGWIMKQYNTCSNTAQFAIITEFGGWTTFIMAILKQFLNFSKNSKLNSSSYKGLQIHTKILIHYKYLLSAEVQNISPQHTQDSAHYYTSKYYYKINL